MPLHIPKHRFVHLIGILLDESWSTDLYVNAYFDTTSRKLSSSQLCTDASINNCNDLIKFYDDTVWNFQSGMTIKFDNPNSRCIRLKSSSSNYRIEGGSCHDWKRMVCRLDCCKF